MDTWYRNAAGRIVTNSPWRVVDYWKLTREVELGDFVLEPAGSPL
jgi:4-hydroxyacetophenone monooxygenase